jgi:DNA-binding beta-propeller fold protein YncE
MNDVTITASGEGPGIAALFFSPHGITTNSTGDMYVADTSNNTIRKITSGGLVSTFAQVFQE